MPVENRFDNIENDLLYAERALLEDLQSFDDERKIFIKDFENSFDVQAVPWSWKTTALLAKIIIMERNFDKIDWWILILSYTNKAVDNIKFRIWKYCSKIFNSEKCFIWTIQSFVDTFLGKPYYNFKYHKKIEEIDDEYWLSSIKKRIWYSYRLKKQTNFNYFSLRINDNWELDWERLVNKNWETYKKLKKAYQDVYNLGIFHFDEMFCLAEKYINEYPIIIDVLRKRFKYIFIDEIQDLEKNHINLIENIFDSPCCVIQKIWDVNQSIFRENHYNTSYSWIPKNYKDTKNPYFISWSYRLSKKNAEIVNQFQLNQDYEKIKWLNMKSKCFSPTLLLYDSWDIDKIINRFIENLNQRWFEKNCIFWSEKINNQDKLRYNVVARRTKDDNNLSLKNYFVEYSKEISEIKRIWRIYYSNMISYLNNAFICRNDFSLVRKTLLYSIINILRWHKIKWKEIYWIRSLYDLLRKDGNMYKNFKTFIYEKCLEIKKSWWNIESLKLIMEDIISKLNIFFWEYGFCSDWLPKNYLSDDTLNNSVSLSWNKSDYFVKDWYYISFDSVHWCKWQDHRVTLFVMTKFYKNDVEYFIDIYNSKKQKKRDVVAQKIFYVWFSRAKDRLCYAVNKEWITHENIEMLKSKGWEIIML